MRGPLPASGRCPIAVSALFAVLLVGPAAVPFVVVNSAGLPMERVGWVQTQKLTPDDADEPGISGEASHWGVHFGSNVVIDGDIIVASTQMSSQFDAGGEDSDGYDWAYVFERGAHGDWEQVSKLVPDDARKGDSFGSSLAVDEGSGRVVVGNPAARQVHVFERSDEGVWEESATVTKDVDGFGVNVAVSKDTFIAGARSGPLFVYEQEAGVWGLLSTIREVGAIADIRGDRIAATVEPDWQKIAVYEREEGDWVQSSSLPLDDVHRSPAARPTRLAFSEDGSTLVAGAYLDRRVIGAQDGDQALGLPSVGSARVYEELESGWVLAEDLSNPDPAPGDKFGWTVGASGDRIVVGAPGDTHNGGDGAGAAYVYESGTDGWVLEQKLRAKDSTLSADVGSFGGGDWFGEGLDLDNRTVVVGAPFDDNRGDGTPYPFNDWGDIPPCIHPGVVSGCDVGEDAGSVYAFQLVSDVSSTTEEKR